MSLPDELRTTPKSSAASLTFYVAGLLVNAVGMAMLVVAVLAWWPGGAFIEGARDVLVPDLEWWGVLLVWFGAVVLSIVLVVYGSRQDPTYPAA